jgi:hypothetical protein
MHRPSLKKKCVNTCFCFPKLEQTLNIGDWGLGNSGPLWGLGAKGQRGSGNSGSPLGIRGNGDWGTRGPLWGLGATGQRGSGIRDRKIINIPITNYQLPITNYQLPITNYQLPITHYPLPIRRKNNWAADLVIFT